MVPATTSYKPGFLILILGILTMFAPFATDTYLAGFPEIAESLNCNSGDVQLSLSTFFFGLAIGQLFYGPVSDRIGRKIPLLTGILIYTLTSVGAPLSPNIEVFVGLRFLQGVGGCAGMIISRAIIRDLFDATQSARVLSLLMVLQALGPILAPILGGYILLITSWHGIFIFLVAVGVLSFAASILFIPETLPMSEREQNPLRSDMHVFLAFIRNRKFIIPTLAGAVGASSMFAFISGSPFVIMELYGVSPQHYGWLFGLNACGFIVSSIANRSLLKHFPPTRILIGGIVFACITSGLALAMANAEHLALLLIPLFCSLSMVPVVAANSVAVAMEQAGKHAGSGSSLIGVLQFGIAALISGLVSALHNGTSYPMLGIIFGVYLLAGVISMITAK
ncbi:multidrug effflux MFS transporter [Desulfogranum japonicum]|uniref:multidrug effflux MFS transporter n=1 Tax=Desulfogranum japonicum TaxID=231447 RepID=UPI0003FB637E|nr:multidrug effflux MFS transporter [Desulfogranum japonicum]